MNQPVELSLEQQFSLRSFEAQVEQMSREQAQQFLVSIYRLMQERECFWKAQLGAHFSGVVVPFYLRLEDSSDFRALVDVDDYVWLMQWKWYSSARGYARRNLSGAADSRQTLMHRLILERVHGPLSRSIDVDHIDGNPLNNQKSNLRLSSHHQNCSNRKVSRNNTSGYKGVSKYRDRWRAVIKVNYRQIHLGYFDSAEEAAIAYNKGAKRYFGDFARLNSIPSDEEMLGDGGQD